MRPVRRPHRRSPGPAIRGCRPAIRGAGSPPRPRPGLAAWQPFREGSPGDQPAALRLFAPCWPLPAHFPRASVKPSSSPWRLSTCALRRPLGEAPGWGTRSRSPGRARRAAPAPRGPRTARKRHPLTPTTHPGTPIGECARRVLQVGVAPGRVPRSGSPPPGRQRLEQRPAAGSVPRAVAGRVSAQRARAGVAAAAGRALGLGARRIGPPRPRRPAQAADSRPHCPPPRRPAPPGARWSSRPRTRSASSLAWLPTLVRGRGPQLGRLAGQGRQQGRHGAGNRPRAPRSPERAPCAQTAADRPAAHTHRLRQVHLHAPHDRHLRRYPQAPGWCESAAVRCAAAALRRPPACSASASACDSWPAPAARRPADPRPAPRNPPPRRQP